MSIRVVKDRTSAFEKALLALIKREVLIGVPAENASRSGDDEPINNATIGYLMEYGEPGRNLPARPHLIPGIEGIRDKIVSRMEAMGKKALSGDLSEIDKGLHAVGLMGQNAVRNKITEGPFTPLAPRTLAERKARGRTGEKPLIDTGQYRRSQTYVVRNKGK